MYFPFDIIADPTPDPSSSSLWWIAAVAIVVVALGAIALVIRARRSR